MTQPFEFPQEIDMAAFISKEAHDLKSPFNRVFGFMKLVLKGLDGPINDDQRNDLNTSLRDSTYAYLLMTNLIDMARLGRGEKAFSPTEHELGTLVEQSMSYYKKANPRQATFEHNISNPAAKVMADDMLMKQGIAQLASYVGEFVQEPVKFNINVEEAADKYLFTITSTGTKAPPPECDLTMHGYIASKILALHQGGLEGGEAKEDGAVVRFWLPK
jgi:K+-sensing histidine kinase KdpD